MVDLRHYVWGTQSLSVLFLFYLILFNQVSPIEVRSLFNKGDLARTL